MPTFSPSRGRLFGRCRARTFLIFDATKTANPHFLRELSCFPGDFDTKNSGPLPSAGAIATESSRPLRGQYCLLLAQSTFFLDDGKRDRLRLLSKHSKKSSGHSVILFKGTEVEQQEITLQTTASLASPKRPNDSAMSTLPKTTAPASGPSQTTQNSPYRMAVYSRFRAICSPHISAIFLPAGKRGYRPPFPHQIQKRLLSHLTYRYNIITL